MRFLLARYRMTRCPRRLSPAGISWGRCWPVETFRMTRRAIEFARHYGTLCDLLRTERLGEAYEILGVHANNSATRTVDVSYQEERNSHNNRQDNEDDLAPLARAVPD